MGNEAASLPVRDYAVNKAAFETADSVSSIAANIQQNIATRFEQFALVTITLSFENEEKSQPYQQTRAYASTIYLLNSLRPLVRKTDVVFLKGSSMHFLLLAANSQGGQIVQSRLWDALLWRIHNISERELLRPRIMKIGSSSYPAPCSDINELLEDANNAKLFFNAQPDKPARKSSGRQSQQTRQPEVDEELPVLARKLGIPYLSLLPRKLPHSLQQLLNPQLAHELGCYPLGRERNTLTVAMLNPQDHSVLDRLRQETGLMIFPVLTHPRALQTVLEQLI